MTNHPLSYQALIKSIQVSISTMNPDEFEDFCYELLSNLEPGFENLQTTSSPFGRARRGKCDMHVYHQDTGRFTVVTCTTQKDDLLRKTKKDIQNIKLISFAPKIQTVLSCIAGNEGEAVSPLHEACEAEGWMFEPRTLQRLARDAVDCEPVMRRFFNQFQYPPMNLEPETANNLDDNSGARKFLAGERLKKIRDDLRYNNAEFIELALSYPSEKAYLEVEAGAVDVEARHLSAAAQYVGADLNWLKYGTKVPYPSRRLSRTNFASDKHDYLEIEAKHAYVAIESKGMRAALLVEETAQRWSHWRFEDRWNIWDWICGDEKYVPEFLEMLRHINRRYHPTGLIVSSDQFDELESGQVHPGNWRAGAGQCLPWFDDLFDYRHRHQHLVVQYERYGEWFIKVQNALRINGGEKKLW